MDEHRQVVSPDSGHRAEAAIFALLGLGLCLPYAHRVFSTGTAGNLLFGCALLLALAVSAAGLRTRKGGSLLLARRRLPPAARPWNLRGGLTRIWNSLSGKPARLLALSFLGAILVGTLLLMLPVAAAPTHPRGIGLLDALFTATSAVCVTGLVVLDTGRDFSAFGQGVILCLIQIGGLGLMTIGMFIALALGHNVGLRGEYALEETIGEQRHRLALKLLRFIVRVTFTIELVGAFILFIGFRATGMSPARSLYYGLFHSISAFCNAGFSLFEDSFQGYAHRPLFPLTLSVLILLGGLGFGVILNLPQLCRRGRSSRPSPHVRLVLATTVALTLVGTLVIWLADRHGALAHLSSGDALINAWFQSVTTRTAGFNTVDLTRLSPQSDFLMRLFMIIGAAPGSTGGGIKVTTFAVLLLLIRAHLRGTDHIVVGERRIEDHTVVSAMVLVIAAGGLILLGSWLLLTTQPLSAVVTPSALIYEAISAFGTVGLSLGVTPLLTPTGRLIIILLMYIGRIGPLSLLLAMQTRRHTTITHPSANVMIG